MVAKIASPDPVPGAVDTHSASQAAPISPVVLAALNKAAATSGSAFVNKCLAFVAAAYGKMSGYASASQAWQDIPAAYKHTTGAPPPGAWVFYSDSNPDGHVALSEGGGNVQSTDFSNGKYEAGTTGIGTIQQVGSAMGGTYLGWTSPYENGVGLLAGNLKSDGALSGVTVGSSSSNSSSSGSKSSSGGGLGEVLGALGSGVFWERVMYILAGAALVIIGIAVVVKADQKASPSIVENVAI